jgi:F0F1-type ATP synthase assembly protein I
MDPDDGRPTRGAGAPARQGSGGLALAGLGLQFAVSLLLFYYLGSWLDRRFGTGPVFLMICVFGGAGVAFYAMYKQLMAVQRREETERLARRAAEPPAKPGAGTSPDPEA